MVDSKKPGDKPKNAASKPADKPQQQVISNADKAARARAFVTAQKEDQNKSDTADYSDTAAAKARKIPRTGFLWFFVICTLGLSGAAGYGVYYLWQQWQLEQNSTLSLEGELQEAQTAIAAVRDDLRNDELRDEFTALQAELGDESASRAEALTATQNTLALLEKTVGRHARQMDALTQTNRDEWLLAETEYLLRLANQRILMSKEITGPLAMLQSADKILREIDDASLIPVRRAIATDITALSRTESVDVDGEYLQLASLAEGIDALKLYDIPEFSNEEKAAPVEASMPEQPTWRDSAAQVGGAIKETLGKVFVVRQRDKPVEAMLAPQQELYLRQNLRLMLEQAQLALLARKPDTYQQSLEKAQQWIAQYFIGEHPATQAALETLDHALAINVDPPLPDISGSYHALKDYSDTEYSRKLKAETAKQMQQKNKPEEDDKAASQSKLDANKESEQKEEAEQEDESEETAEPVQNKEPESKQEPEPKIEPESKQEAETGEKSDLKQAAKPDATEEPQAEAKPEKKPEKQSASTPKPQPEPEGKTNGDQPEAGAEEAGADAAEEL